jgi:hypothetical protein
MKMSSSGNNGNAIVFRPGVLHAYIFLDMKRDAKPMPIYRKTLLHAQLRENDRFGGQNFLLGKVWRSQLASHISYYSLYLEM